MSEDRRTFIQWKGTDVCMDIYWPCCDAQTHIDGDFAYSVKCPYCQTIYKLGNEVTLEPLQETDPNYDSLKRMADHPNYQVIE